MSKIAHVTDNEFEQTVLNSDLPVLVDYWAEWCNPCKAIAPLLEDIAEKYAGKIKVYKLNISNNIKTAQTYGVRNIPTLMIFKQGNAVATKVGSINKSQLCAFIDATLN